MPTAPADRLDSWKQIAAYLHRSVRTVRRWEHEEGLPVHRHVHRTLASVYALKSEVDAWRQAAARGPESSRAAVFSRASAPTRSIAVLPFANLSTDPENEYFADGLTDEVTTTLAKVRALRVISRLSSMTLRGTSKGAKAISAQLGVRYLLEGSVRRAGQRLRITAQLIDATNDDHLWADTYDGTVDDVFTIQEQLARVIVDALELRLTASEEQRIAERAIDNLPAYECYLRARHEAWRWRKDSIDQAVQLLREGLAIIGDNVRLHAALGVAYLQYREAGIDFGERPLLEAERCASKLFELERDLAWGLQLRGWIRYSRGLVQEAVHDLKAALDIEPNNADTLLLLSNCYLISGRVSSARPLLTRLLAVDPLTPVTRCMPAFADILDGNFAAALEPYRQMFEMDPSNPMARLFYAWVLIINRMEHEMGALVEDCPSNVRDTVPARIAFFLAFALAGKRREAQAVLTPQIEAAARATDVFARFLAQGFALAGMAEPTMRWLEVAVDRGFINYPFLARHDPFFRSLRSDARFKRLLDIVRDRWERFEA
jgi:TolB-like protein/cytochrome c-type biogenesis protein CcmH/NrfG